MNIPRPPLPRQSGFSLVELMVAALLGLVLTAGVVSVYLASQKDSGLNNALGAAQQSGQSALGFLEPKIRMAGFFGCGRSEPESILKSDLLSDSVSPIEGYEYSGTGMGETYSIPTAVPSAATHADAWSPALPPDIRSAVGLDAPGPGSAVPGSDILLLHETAPVGASLVDPYTDGADGLFIASAQDAQLTVGELAVVSDCRHSDVFQITDIAKDDQSGRSRIGHSSDASLEPGNASPAHFGDDSYGEGSQILPFGTYLFYVGTDQNKNPGLYEVSLRSDGTLENPVELVQGIEDMQLAYGLDTDGDGIPNQFLTADQVGDWNRVVSVRIALLTLSSGSSAETGASSFSLLDPSRGLTVTVARDGRVRRAFEETISIRNRLP